MQCGGCCLRNSIPRPLPNAVRMFTFCQLKGAGPLHKLRELRRQSSTMRGLSTHFCRRNAAKYLGSEQPPQHHHKAPDYSHTIHMDRWGKRYSLHCSHRVRFLEGFSIRARRGQNPGLRTQRFPMELHAAHKRLDGNHRVSPTTWIFQRGRYQALGYVCCLVHPRGSLVWGRSERNPATDSRGL
jgi:hypothetical protein